MHNLPTTEELKSLGNPERERSKKRNGNTGSAATRGSKHTNPVQPHQHMYPLRKLGRGWQRLRNRKCDSRTTQETQWASGTTQQNCFTYDYLHGLTLQRTHSTGHENCHMVHDRAQNTIYHARLNTALEHSTALPMGHAICNPTAQHASMRIARPNLHHKHTRHSTSAVRVACPSHTRKQTHTSITQNFKTLQKFGATH